MNIYTTCYINLIHIDKNIIPISISQEPPSGYKGKSFPALRPKGTHSQTGYVTGFDDSQTIETFRQNVLSKLNQDEIVQELKQMSNDHDIVLVCFEKDPAKCHRRIVAQWLEDAGYGTVIELTKKQRNENDHDT